MSSITSFPIKLAGSNLQFGKASVPLASAKSFAVPLSNKPKISIYCQEGDYKTTFHLLFTNVNEMHKSIEFFMKNTEIRPSLFTIREVNPQLAAVGASVRGKKGALRTSPSISFKFTNVEERGLFFSYCVPLLNVSRAYWANADFPSAAIELWLSEEDEVKRINDIFKRIMNRFDCGLNDALLELKDSHFPSQSKLSNGSNISSENAQHFQEYNVTAEGISPITSNSNTQEHEEKSGSVNVNSTALESEEEQKQQTHLKNALKEAIKGNPADNKKIHPLMTKVLSIPGFNLYAFMEEVVGKR